MTEAEQISKANFKRVVYLGICFMTLFTAYIAAQNLISQIYSQYGHALLGQIYLFTVAMMIVVVSPVAAHFNKIIPLKVALVGGAIAHVTLIFSGALVSYCGKEGKTGGFCSSFSLTVIHLLSSLSVGICAAFLWLRQAIYVNECADEKTKGLFNGTFWSIFQTAQIIGSTVAAAMLGSFEPFTFYCLLMLFGAAAITMFNFVEAPLKNPENAEVVEEENKETVVEAVRNFAGLLKVKEYYFLFFALYLSGLAIGSYINFLGAYVTATLDSKDSKYVNQCVGYALLILAFGEVGAGLSTGKLADRFDKLKLFTITILLNEVALLMSLIAIVLNSYYLVLFAALLYGYGDTSIQTMINAVIGSLLGGKAELYSAYRCFQNIGVLSAALIAMFIPRDQPIVYIMVIGTILLIFHVLYQKFLPTTTQKNSEYNLMKDEKAVELQNL